MIGKIKTFLNDYVISRRWFVFALNGAAMAMLLFSGIFSSYWWVSLLDFFMAGFLFSLVVSTAMLPGLFKGIQEADQAVMRAQFEKQMTEAINEIKRQHPEIGDIQITRTMQ